MMRFDSSTCILSAHRRLEGLAAEMKDFPEDRRESPESHGNSALLIGVSENVNPSPTPACRVSTRP